MTEKDLLVDPSTGRLFNEKNARGRAFELFRVGRLVYRFTYQGIAALTMFALNDYVPSHTLLVLLELITDLKDYLEVFVQLSPFFTVYPISQKLLMDQITY